MLTMYQLEITIEATTQLALDPYCGSALRGAFFHALWRRFCANHEAATCYECPLNSACPVAKLVAPLRDEAPRGRDAPRPYIITPLYTGKEQYEVGDSYTFGFSLIGSASQFYPYVLRAILEMERYTLGHPLKALQGKRGSFRVCKIDAVYPFTQQRVCLWQQGARCPEKLQAGITEEDIVARAGQLSSDHLTIHFVSPTRLVAGERVLRKPDFTVLILRMAERLERVQRTYGQRKGNEKELDREWYLALKAKAERVELVRDETYWVDIRSYSTRQRQQISIGGFLGKVSFAGPMADLYELLTWGELLRVGKNIVKGAGFYHMEA